MSPPGSPAAEHRPHPLAALATLAYLVLALAIGGAVVFVTAPNLQGPTAVLAGVFAIAAFAAERTSRRADDLYAKNVAPALYVLAALLLPAPWAVLIAAGAVVACHLTRGGIATGIRIIGTAHTIVVVALFTVLAHVLAADAGYAHGPMEFLPWLQYALRLPLRVAEPGVGAGGAVGSMSLAGLAVAAYLLDAVPLALMGPITRRTYPSRAWSEIFGRTLFAEIAVPCLGILVAVTYNVAPAAAVLALPPLLGVGWALKQAARRATSEDAPGSGGIVAGEARHEEQDRLNAVLTVVRAVGGQSDLAEVTRALAQAAIQLTQFRSGTVYLYESHDGLFVPYATSDGIRTLKNSAPIGRDSAALMMSLHNRLSYSYYTPTEREHVGQQGKREHVGQHGNEGYHDAGVGPARDRWRGGDVLLVPLLLSNGDVSGFIVLDAPADGQVPRAEDLVPLESVAALGAGVITRLRHAHEVLHLATSDSLTGLLNRRAFEERLAGELTGSGYRRPVALMMIDLDDFGSINNTYGHQIGDEALRLVSGVIRRHLRQADAGGRYGGDEFVVILPGLDDVGAVEVAERVRAALVEATTRAAAEGRLPQLHTSIGVAVYPHHAADAATLVKVADDALYTSKRLGKNRVSLHSAA